MKKNNIIASVIVSSYNHNAYILNALDSIKSQNEKKIEIIILDDYSTDGSIDKIKIWKKKNRYRFNEILIISHIKQHGISDVTLELLASTRSNLVLPLASDDMFLPHTVDERISFLNENPKIWVRFSDGSAVDNAGEVIVNSLYKYYKHQFADASYAVLKKELIVNWNYPANIQFWRKGDWVHEISPSMFSAEVEIALAALSNNKIKYLNKILYQYRCGAWPIQVKGCEKDKRLHLSFYYRKAASQSAGMTKYALLKLSEYNLSIAANDITQARKLEKKIHFIKKLPAVFFQ